MKKFYENCSFIVLNAKFNTADAYNQAQGTGRKNNKCFSNYQ